MANRYAYLGCGPTPIGALVRDYHEALGLNEDHVAATRNMAFVGLNEDHVAATRGMAFGLNERENEYAKARLWGPRATGPAAHLFGLNEKETAFARARLFGPQATGPAADLFREIVRLARDEKAPAPPLRVVGVDDPAQPEETDLGAIRDVVVFGACLGAVMVKATAKAKPVVKTTQDACACICPSCGGCLCIIASMKGTAHALPAASVVGDAAVEDVVGEISVFGNIAVFGAPPDPAAPPPAPMVPASRHGCYCPLCGVTLRLALGEPSGGPSSGPLGPSVVGVIEVMEEETAAEQAGTPDEAEELLPLARKLYRHYRGADAAPYIRLDTPEAYATLREGQSDDVQALRQKVAEMDATLQAHLSDGHGGPGGVGVEDVVGAFAEDLSVLLGAADPERKRIPLSLPPWLRDHVECWREGDMVCCSMALPGWDGDVRIATTATAIQRHARDVARWANQANGDVVDLLGILPTAASMMAGGSVLPALAAATPSLLEQAEAAGGDSFVGRVVPATAPSKATLVGLLQAAQVGHKQARQEWGILADAAGTNDGLRQSMEAAREALVRAQGGS